VDKRSGYYVLSVGFIGTIANQFLKLWFRIPRPWVIDKDFTILEQAREAAAGYSFPSGHTQNAVGTFGSVAHTVKNKVVKTAAIVVAILVPISRMYIGVHTPLDVLVAAAMALALIFVIQPVVYGKDGKYFPVLLGIMTVSAVAFLCFVEFYPFPADTDPHNLASGIKNAYTLLGCLVGLLIVYIVDEKWLHFPVKAVWWAQILKVVIGLALVLGVKTGTKTILNGIFGETIGRSARYFLIVIVVGIVWPLTFHWFSRLGTKE
jgi:undecaprenyl-diphosphatase